jgi:glutathione S-transferase
MPGHFNLLKERNRDARGSLRSDLIRHLRFIETVAPANATAAEPYWMGRDVTLVDYAFYPFFERFVSVETYRGITVPPELALLRLWLSAMARRGEVKQIATRRDYYVEYFGRNLRGQLTVGRSTQPTYCPEGPTANRVAFCVRAPGIAMMSTAIPSAS